eukprot:Skav229997  [mRNA]  locus=scaffold17:104820:108095:- [translate_table: standard]
MEADKLVQERYEKLVLGLRALDAAKEKQDTPRKGMMDDGCLGWCKGDGENGWMCFG